MSEALTVLAGLGNPGDKYEQTRHNAGFWLVDELARRHGGSFRQERRYDAEVCRIDIDGHDLWLVKPMSYMNQSGGPLRAFVDYYRVPVTGLMIAHDEIDLPVGTLKIKKGGGHGGHNGLRDSIACLGRDFVRLRMGVGHPGSKDEVVDFVLKRASAKEQELLDAATEKAADAIPIALKRGVDIAMNRLNVKPKKKKAPKPAKAVDGDSDEQKAE